MPQIATAVVTEGAAELVADQAEQLISAYLSPSLTQKTNF